MRTTKPNSWRILAIIALAAGLAGAGCGDDDSTNPDAFDPPGGIKVVNGDQSVVIGWTASPDEGDGDFRRYAIFRGVSSLVGVTGTQLEAARVGVADAGDITYTDTFGANGIRYYYHVRSEKDDGSLSGASTEVLAAGREEGTGVIIEEFESDGDSGFDFSTGSTVSLNAANEDRFELTDLYLGTTDEDDATSAPLSLKSPELLVRLGNNEWEARDTDIKNIGEVWEITTTAAPGAGWANEQPVERSNVYAIKTPSGNYAKLMVLDVNETVPGAREITFKWAYQPTPNLVIF